MTLPKILKETLSKEELDQRERFGSPLNFVAEMYGGSIIEITRGHDHYSNNQYLFGLHSFTELQKFSTEYNLHYLEETFNNSLEAPPEEVEKLEVL